jgi:hypothetical protein
MDDEKITPEELDEILDGYIREVPNDEPIREQARIFVREASSIVLNTGLNILVGVLHLSIAFLRIFSAMSKDIQREFSSKHQSPDRGFGWECFIQTVWLLFFGGLISVSITVLHSIPAGPPHHLVKALIEWIHWGYYIVVISVQTIRYLIHEFKEIFEAVGE